MRVLLMIKRALYNVVDEGPADGKNGSLLRGWESPADD